MRLSRTAARAAVAALALPLLLTACSGGSTDTATPAPASEAAVTPEASPSQSAPDVTAPDGYQLVTATTSGISFAIPDSWVVLSPEDLSEAASPEALQEAADATGITTDQMTQILNSRVDLYASAATPDENGFTENVNVAPAGVSSLPTQAAFEAILSQVSGGALQNYSTHTTGLGEAAAATYTMEMQGVSLYGSQIVVESAAGSYWSVTVTTTNEERVAELTAAVIDSLS